MSPNDTEINGSGGRTGLSFQSSPRSRSFARRSSMMGARWRTARLMEPGMLVKSRPASLFADGRQYDYDALGQCGKHARFQNVGKPIDNQGGFDDINSKLHVQLIIVWIATCNERVSYGDCRDAMHYVAHIWELRQRCGCLSDRQSS